jgi:hypothetical protein
MLMVGWQHPKNHHALRNYPNIVLTLTENLSTFAQANLSNFDVVYSPALPIDVSLYPGKRFLFGPHFSIFPEPNWAVIKSRMSFYISPSDWTRKLYQRYPVTIGLKVVVNPFGVDTKRFQDSPKPRNSLSKIMVMFKDRESSELALIERALKTRGLDYKVFSYRDKYDEGEYIRYMQKSKYGIWLGRHESQGFALEEALASNLPLLVWNARSLYQDAASSPRFPEQYATVIPYWDNRCGEYFHYEPEFEGTYTLFLHRLQLGLYHPRKYIEEHLSMSVCEDILIKHIEDLPHNLY